MNKSVDFTLTHFSFIRVSIDTHELQYCPFIPAKYISHQRYAILSSFPFCMPLHEFHLAHTRDSDSGQVVATPIMGCICPGIQGSFKDFFNIVNSYKWLQIFAITSQSRPWKAVLPGSNAGFIYKIHLIKHLIFECNSERNYYICDHIKCTCTTNVFREVVHLEAVVRSLEPRG